MKKLIFNIISTILLIFGFVCSYQKSKYLGIGKNNNEKVETIEKTEDIFASLIELMEGTLGNQSQVNLSSQDNSSDQSIMKLNKHLEDVEFSNMSFTEKTVSNVKVQYKAEGYKASMDEYLNRTMDCYFTDEAVYYKINFYMAISTEQRYTVNEQTIKMYVKETIDLNLEIYFSDDDLLIKINDLFMTTYYKDNDNEESETYNFYDDYTKIKAKDKWIDFSENQETVYEAFSQINCYNIETFKDIYELISLQNNGKEVFDEQGVKYKLKEEYFKELVNSIMDNEIFDNTLINADEDINGNFTIILPGDLVNMNILLDLDFEEKKNDTTINCNGYEKDEFKITNINNTLIDGFDDIQIIDYSELNLDE